MAAFSTAVAAERLSYSARAELASRPPLRVATGAEANVTLGSWTLRRCKQAALIDFSRAAFACFLLSRGLRKRAVVRRHAVKGGEQDVAVASKSTVGPRGGLAVGDRVTWTFSNNRVPSRSVGTVVDFEEGGVTVEFPRTPKLNRQLVSTAEGKLPVGQRVSILLPGEGWEDAAITQVYSRLERGSEVISYKVSYDSTGKESLVDLRDLDSKLILTREDATLLFRAEQLKKVDEENVQYGLEDWWFHFCSDQYFIRTRLFEVGVTPLFMVLLLCLVVVLIATA
eukprot:TRINITY_DN101833_c0_g1_i1.p1 TRINITY_DN101833_c0_g1~~TRINITY_DN101833_c0_g1_i1.p1  ORF type:complete len:283 (+),score=38.60 TRINITY_DN101833_c0_g1_i1:64-912(+)